MRRILPILGGLAALGAPVSAADVGDVAPAALFANICTQGGARLSASDVREARFVDLPSGARIALGFDLSGRNGMAVGLMQPLAARDVPNRVLAIGHGAGRFLLPSAADRSGALAQSCSIVWQGRHFDEARRTVAGIVGMKDGGDADISPVSDAHLFVVTGDGYHLVASEMAGWTVMRMTPDMPPAAAPQPAVSSGTTVRDNGRGEVVVKSGKQK